MKKYLKAGLAYLLVTFPLAVLWHLVVFKETYDALGIFSREEPIVALGFFVILFPRTPPVLRLPFVLPGRPSREGRSKVWSPHGAVSLEQSGRRGGGQARGFLAQLVARNRNRLFRATVRARGPRHRPRLRTRSSGDVSWLTARKSLSVCAKR